VDTLVLCVAGRRKNLREREEKKEEGRNEEGTFTAINIIFNILDQFLHFCCSCRCRAISKVIDNKSSATKKMSNSIPVRNEVQVKVISIFNI